MSEQFWYTWSDSGFGTTTGDRVRAASASLTNVTSPRMRILTGLSQYKLPQEIDSYLPPEQAPLCLTFLKVTLPKEDSNKIKSKQDAKKVETEIKEVLIQRSYSGLDGVRRPGAFFSHLLIELPEISSRRPSGQMPFSAREAINLWRSSALWQRSEQSLPKGKLDLPTIPDNDLLSREYAGTLDERVVVHTPDLFRRVLEAFLTLAGSGKRLYLVGNPDTVAALIWGITHALPRTLTIMRDLTFSTFESELEAGAKPLIVGTCWLPQYVKQGYENARLDVSEQYYQPGNAYGLTIHCDDLHKWTPFTPSEDVRTYVEFVLKWMSDGKTGMRVLTALLDKAEQLDITDLETFLAYAKTFQGPLSEDALMRLLQRLRDSVAALCTRALDVLRKDKFSAAVEAAAHIGTIQADVDFLFQDNVQQTFWLLITEQKPRWWTEQGQKIIGQLYQLTAKPSRNEMTKARDDFRQRMLSSLARSRDQGRGEISLLPDAQRYATPHEALAAFSQIPVESISLCQQALQEALRPLADHFAEQLLQALWTDQRASAGFWDDPFRVAVEQAGMSTSSHLWAEMLQNIARDLRYTTTFVDWWRHYGKAKLAQLRVDYIGSDTEIANGFTALARTVAPHTLNAIQSNDASKLMLLSEMLKTLASPKYEPGVWITFLPDLGQIAWSSPYENWWTQYGESFLKEIKLLLTRPGTSDIQNAFLSFCRNVTLSLQKAMQPYVPEELAFQAKLFASAAPYQSWPDLWLDFLLDVRDKLTSAGFATWWNGYGKEAARFLREQAEANQVQISSKLITFTTVCMHQLRAVPVAVYQQQLQDDNIIVFLLDILVVTVPEQNNGIWLEPLEKLPIGKETGWNVRAPFLRQWQRIPADTLAGPEAQAALRRWLEVSWSDLEALLALGLPANWSKVAITKALEDLPSLPPTALRDLLAPRYQPLFEEVLQSLILNARIQAMAINFLALLAQQNYANILGLLGRLLTSCHSLPNREEVARLLLQVVPLSSQEIAPFLEIHCTELLTRYELTETMRQLLTTYLSNFDLDYLDADPTRNLLKTLKEREKSSTLRLPVPLQQAVESWYTLAQFLAPTQEIGLHSLAMLTNVNLPAEARQKLNTKLTPRLVKLATSEGTLAIILYILGQGNEYQLLLAMARVAGERFGQDQPPVRLAPYVRCILEKSSLLASPQKEAFIDDSLRLLFERCDTKIVAKVFPEQLWPQLLIIEWQRWTDRKRSNELNKKLAAFRQAIKEYHLPHILKAFDPAFEQMLNEYERVLIGLAHQFVAACEANDDANILLTYAYLMQQEPKLHFGQNHINRLKQAYAWQDQQQAAAAEALRASAAAQQGGNQQPGMPPRQNEVAQPVKPLKAIELPNVGVPPKPAPPARTPYVNPAQPVAPPVQEPAASAQPVATVNGIAISAEEFEWAERLKLLYLQKDKSDKQKEVQNLDPKRDKNNITALSKGVVALQKIIEDPVKCRRSVLDDLINNVLIKSEIERLRPVEGLWWQEFERTVATRAAVLHQDLRIYTGNSNKYLMGEDEATVSAVRRTLRIFVRFEDFDVYLRKKGRPGIADWIKEQEAKTEIKINKQYFGTSWTSLLKRYVSKRKYVADLSV